MDPKPYKSEMQLSPITINDCTSIFSKAACCTPAISGMFFKNFRKVLRDAVRFVGKCKNTVLKRK